MKLGDSLKKTTGYSGEEGPEEEAAEESTEDSSRELSDAVFQALKADDPEAFHNALGAFIRDCMGPDSEPESSSGPKKKEGLAILLGGK